MTTVHDSRSLTSESDWELYYGSRGVGSLKTAAEQPSRIPFLEEYLGTHPGKIFELGGGGSPVLARSAALGWAVGAIDFNIGALDLTKNFVEENNLSSTEFVYGDATTYDCSVLPSDYDLIYSGGFLEHFENPTAILLNWKALLKTNGLVISVIPNLQMFNALAMRVFDNAYWRQHVAYTPEQIDNIHQSAGLVPVRPAVYAGRYDMFMLTPWGKIEAALRLPIVSKILLKLAKFCLDYPLKRLPDHGYKYFSSYIVGVYCKE